MLWSGRLVQAPATSYDTSRDGVAREPRRLRRRSRHTATPKTMRGKTDSHTALSIVTDDFWVCWACIQSRSRNGLSTLCNWVSCAIQSCAEHLEAKPVAVRTMAPI